MHYVTIDKFTELTGYSAKAVYAKVRKGQWLRGQVFEKAPDGRILINMEEYYKWVKNGTVLTASALQVHRQ